LTGVGEKTVVCVRRPAEISRQADFQAEMIPTLIRNMQEKPPDHPDAPAIRLAESSSSEPLT